MKIHTFFAHVLAATFVPFFCHGVSLDNRTDFCSSPDQVGMTLKSWYFGHTNGGSGKWSQCEELCRDDPRCNSWMGRNSGNACYLSEDIELRVKPAGCCRDHHPHTFGYRNCEENFCSSPEQVGMTLKSWYFGHTNGGSGKWSQCEELCRNDPKCNSWMGRNSGNTCYLSEDIELKVKPAGCCQDHHPHTFGYENCRENFCSSPDQVGMTLKSWYFGHENGGSGKWSQCEELCRDDPRCNSWMGRNSGNTCYLSEDVELKVKPSGCCSDHHPHTFGYNNCRETFCSSPEQVGMTLKSWYLGHTNGGSGKWSQCEELCRDDPKCNSWMGRNSGNTCYLSEDRELKVKPIGCCRDHHPHTFGNEYC